MRCPKCQYLGFDGHTRCRNCGYDLSLTSTIEAAPLQVPSAPGSPDLPLRAEPSAREQARAAIRQRATGAGSAAAHETFDLPLFSTPGTEDRPVSPPPVARPPLSVRRPVADTPRPRAAALQPAPQVDEPRLELDLIPTEPIDPGPVEIEVPPEPVAVDLGRTEVHDEVPAAVDLVDERVASVSARLLAGLVDAALLAALAVAVVVSTLRVTGLPLEQVGRLPPGPLAAFLALLTVGYLSMCTVLSGRTAGKALVGVQVVEVGGRAVRFGPAVVRAALQVVTVPLLGLGFLPAVLSADRRALYDRLANTEVIRTRR